MSRILGYISFFLVLSLCMCSFYKKYDKKIYAILLKIHKLIVILILILSLIHGILAGNVIGMISGKVSWFVLFVSLLVISIIKKYSIRNRIHHIFTFIFLVICLSHILFLW